MVYPTIYFIKDGAVRLYDGSRNVRDFVDFATASVIEEQIITTIDNFEPRVANVQVDVDPQPDNNTFNVTIFYDIVGQDFPIQEFSFLLEATR